MARGGGSEARTFRRVVPATGGGGSLMFKGMMN